MSSSGCCWGESTHRERLVKPGKSSPLRPEASGPTYNEAQRSSDPHVIGDVILKTRLKVRWVQDIGTFLKIAASNAPRSLTFSGNALGIIFDRHPLMLHHNGGSANVGSQPRVFSVCQFCSRTHAIKRTLCDPKDLRWEAATLRQTQLSGAGKPYCALCAKCSW